MSEQDALVELVTRPMPAAVLEFDAAKPNEETEVTIRAYDDCPGSVRPPLLNGFERLVEPLWDYELAEQAGRTETTVMAASAAESVPAAVEELAAETEQAAVPESAAVAESVAVTESITVMDSTARIKSMASTESAKTDDCCHDDDGVECFDVLGPTEQARQLVRDHLMGSTRRSEPRAATDGSAAEAYRTELEAVTESTATTDSTVATKRILAIVSTALAERSAVGTTVTECDEVAESASSTESSERHCWRLQYR